MPLFKRSTHVGSERKCGPTLMLSMLIIVIGLFATIWVFNHRNSQTTPQADRSSAPSNLPKQ